MFCPTCQVVRVSRAIFCNVCGTKLQESPLRQDEPQRKVPARGGVQKSYSAVSLNSATVRKAAVPKAVSTASVSAPGHGASQVQAQPARTQPTSARPVGPGSVRGPSSVGPVGEVQTNTSVIGQGVDKILGKVKDFFVMSPQPSSLVTQPVPPSSSSSMSPSHAYVSSTYGPIQSAPDVPHRSESAGYHLSSSSSSSSQITSPHVSSYSSSIPPVPPSASPATTPRTSAGEPASNIVGKLNTIISNQSNNLMQFLSSSSSGDSRRVKTPKAETLAQIINNCSTNRGTELNLSQLRLTEFPSQILFNLYFQNNLIVLDISQNSLSELPETISLLSSLTSLDVSNNRLNDLPSSLSSIATLSSLKLHGNNFSSPISEIALRGLSALKEFLRNRESVSAPSSADPGIMHKIQTGLFLHLDYMSKQPRSDSFTDSDFVHKQTLHIRSLEGLCFRSYASEAFQSLRSRQDIPLKDFSESLTKHLYSELGVSGRSGSFLYITKDKRFIIKTLTHSESKFLRTFFRQYYEHIRNHPTSLLTRFLGMYRLIDGITQYRFIVMSSAFPPGRTISEKYDLKGSTIDRKTLVTGVFEPLDVSSVILKDMDLIKRLKIKLGRSRKLNFMNRVIADCNFLEQFGIMDYSMLLGLHVPENIEEEQFDRETGITADGGIVASDRNGVFLPEIYYVQIIDILQLYNARKILEHNMKALIYESDGISSIPPDRYCIRFQNFIASYVE